MTRLPGLRAFAADRQDLRRKVDVAPLQLEEFASSQPGVERHQHQRGHVVGKRAVFRPGLVAALAAPRVRRFAGGTPAPIPVSERLSETTFLLEESDIG